MATTTSLTPRAPYGKALESRKKTVLPVTDAARGGLSRSGNQPRRLHQFFERTCGRSPDALAIDFVETGERLTYAQLDARSAQLARRLVRLGVVPNDRSALHLPRGVEPYIAMLGVLRAGAAYVPIDIETPE